MDFNDTQEEAKFRKEASEWLKTNFEKFDSERSANDKSSKSSAEPSKTPMDESKSLELAKNGKPLSTMQDGLVYIGPRIMEVEMLLPSRE
jgi:hypothetical protein